MSDKKFELFEKAEKEMGNFGELMKHADKTRWKEEKLSKADEYERKETEGKKEKDPKDMIIEDKGDTAKEKGKKLSSASSRIFKAEMVKFDANGQWSISKADDDYSKPLDVAIGEGSAPSLPGNEDSADKVKAPAVAEKSECEEAAEEEVKEHEEKMHDKKKVAKADEEKYRDPQMKPDKMERQKKWNLDMSHVADPKVKAASKKKVQAVERTKGKPSKDA